MTSETKPSRRDTLPNIIQSRVAEQMGHAVLHGINLQAQLEVAIAELEDARAQAESAAALAAERLAAAAQQNLELIAENKALKSAASVAKKG